MKTETNFSSAAVVGAGSWGTALALVLAESGLPVTLWCHDPAQAAAMATVGTNEEFLPGIPLPTVVRVTTDIAEAAAAPLILMVPPSNFLRGVAARLAAAGPAAGTVLVSCSKGLEAGTGLRMSQVVAAELPACRVAVLSGPSHAEEVARKLASALVIGSDDPDLARALQQVFTLGWFRTYTSSDAAGIELGGAIKNVFAIAGGIVDGLGLGDNAKAAMVTRGLAELTRLGVALGGRPETFAGLSGVGDLIVTCYSEHSRNHRVGESLGRGLQLAEIQAQMGHMVAEGVPNAASIHGAARKAGVETPIIDQIYAVLYQGKAPAAALAELLARQPRAESDREA
jgi:glycerol-3-phosphate dehydrogenase (NAD(P)+)